MSDLENSPEMYETKRGADEVRPISNRLLEGETRNMASFAVSPGFLEQAICMPPNHEIVGAEWDFASRSIRLFIEGPSLPSVPRGNVVLSVTPNITKSVEPDGRVRFTWDWNL